MTALSTAGVTGGGAVAPPTPVRARRGAGAWRFVVFAVLGLYFLVPIAASVWFTVRSPDGVSLRRYAEIPAAEGFAEAFTRSLALAGLTVVLALVLMVPTVVLVELRLPPAADDGRAAHAPAAGAPADRAGRRRAQRARVGAGLLPRTPRWPRPSSPSRSRTLPWILVLVYVVLALPFVYRALDAGVRGSDLRTLTEAARNLGASWPRVLVSVVLPVLRTSVLNASFLTLALVLGEYTVAAILGFETVPDVDRADLRLAAAAVGGRLGAVASSCTWMLLLLISALDRRRGTKESA